VTLPSDLERLGDHLEVAALRAVRRRARRQTALNALCALAVSALVAIALTAVSGATAERPPAPAAPIAPIAPLADSAVGPAEDVSFHHIGQQPPPAPAMPPCVDATRCGRPSPPTRLMFYPDPARSA
jgi:hypothetical protein